MTPVLARDHVEDRLVEQARAGDFDAYCELFERHRDAALRVAAVVLGSSWGADDVVQDATVRAWRAIERFEAGRPFRPWLLRIVANLARNERRSRGRRANLTLRVSRAERVDHVMSPEDTVVRDLERERVVAALNRIDADDRLIVGLRYFEQLSEREIADVLDCAPGTVKSRLARAKGRLRGELERIAVAAIAVVLLVTLAVAPVRRAVADWFSIGSTRIERDNGDEGDPSGLPGIDDGVPEIDARRAAQILGRPVPTSQLGPPDLFAEPPEGGVLLVWPRGSTTLWVLPTEDPAALRMRKVLDEHDTAEAVAALGEAAVYASGDHILATPQRRIAAGSVLLWIDDGLEFRLGSDLGRDELLAIARSVTAPATATRSALNR